MIHPWQVIAEDARKALDRGDLVLAEKLLALAEKSKADIEKYGTLTNPNPLVRLYYEEELSREKK